ncbi:MFS general substrate transporter [Aspergillus piperis CBS 112811]|uniref:MFS general substrate transporter n=1 Tax=Aspergillus piperis CBS 112811 TaxID=1448313 RepID=A0A8G1QZN8_9EURO|nr:MFS general substrate transporter [Aspergillus piperis CBS 112811]RAH55936.1 MFS general substrate transporter [Aspergillus piperis CBS 112811]
MELFRDTTFGKLIRVLTRGRVLPYPEETCPSAWSLYVQHSQDPHDPEFSLEPTDSYGLYTVLSQATQSRSYDTPESVVKVGDDFKIITWRESGDSENPQNWSLSRKVFVSLQIWVLTFAIYIGSAIYTPGIPGVSEQFHVSTVAATLGLTLFVLGYGIGPMLWSPLGELPVIGRTPIYMTTLTVFVFFNFAVIYAKNFGMFLAFRFLTGMFGSPVLASGAASMGDIWDSRVRDYMIAIWGCFAVSAPVLGPVIGGFASSAMGWTWTIWPLLWMSGAVLVCCFIFLPETFAPNILYRRARRLRKITGNQNLFCEAEIELSNMKKTSVVFEALIRPFQLCFTEPIVFLMNLYIALIYGILYIWFEAFPIVFEELRGFNPGENGLAFLGCLVGACCVAVPGYFYWKYKWQSKHIDSNGNLAPEQQLPPACFGAVCLPISLFWFGWTGNFASIHWIAPVLASLVFTVGAVLIFNAIFCYQTHAYPKYAASVLAGNDFFRSSFGAGFPLFATAMFHNLGIGWACTLLGCLCVVFLPYPFFLYFRGRRFRLASKFARHDI